MRSARLLPAERRSKPIRSDQLGGENLVDAVSTLETIAEIAVSITGFAGIVGALAGEKLGPAHPDVWFPFWAMISSGLGLLFAALFPLLPYHLGAPDPVIWASGSAFLTVLLACNLSFFMPRIWRAQRNGAFPRIFAISVPLDASAVVIFVTQALNVLGIGLVHSAGGFLIGLYLLLLISGLNFVFLLYVLSRPR
jgi:hypothetical protein